MNFNRLLSLAGFTRIRALKKALKISKKTKQRNKHLKKKNISINRKLAELEKKSIQTENLLNSGSAHIRIIAAQLYSIKTNKKEARNYVELASMLYLSFRSIMGSYWSDDYQILNNGATNLFTAEVCHENQKYFLKATTPKRDSEFIFYGLLLNDTLNQDGKFYTFVKPFAIVEHEHARAYVFPFIESKRLTYSPESIDRAIIALAEMISSNYFKKIPLSTKLSEWKPTIKPTSIKEVSKSSLFESNDAKRDALRRLELILSKWDSTLKELKSHKYSLSSHDLELHTKLPSDNKITILDMGCSAFYPLGSELFLLFSGQIRSTNAEIVCQKYSAALKDFGILISEKEIKFAACATAAWKLLGGDAKKLSARKIENYIYGLECAEYCISSCQA